MDDGDIKFWLMSLNFIMLHFCWHFSNSFKIFQFLFCDAKLHPSQPWNGGNTSTTTTAEDEVEDKFYLSYKVISHDSALLIIHYSFICICKMLMSLIIQELSKYFKSAQLSSLTSRLAICMCIVNKYHGGLGAVNQLWGEFVLEMKCCL